MHSIKAHKEKLNRKWNKSKVLVVSAFLLIALTVGGTLSFLTDKADDVVNTFEPGKVTTEVNETLSGDIKKDVSIKNTGNITAYIRAAVVVTWQDENGNVYGQAPASNVDYEITYNLSDDGWKLSSDGFYYWTVPVKSVEEAPSDCNTGVLISKCMLKEGAQAPDGYSLNVEIIGSGIQSLPTTTVTTEWSSGVSGIAEDGTTLVIK